MTLRLQSLCWSIALSLFCVSPAWAETLNIKVLQMGTGDPVDGATVVLKNNGVFDTTNAKGEVSLEVIPMSDELKVLSPGYDTLLQNVDETTSTLTLYLVPNLAELEGLEVVEERKSEKVSKVVLSKQELLRAPGSQGDPIKVLQSLPGVVSAASSGAGQVYMRGSETQENIYWVNELPVSYLYHWGGLNSVINPALVSDFNVFLGGFPVEYGDFLGGAVDIKLRAPQKDRIHTNLHLGTYESSFLVEGPLGDAGTDSFYIAARRSYIDLLFSADSFSNLGGSDTKNSFVLVPKFYDAQALYRHETDKGYIDVQYFAASDQLELLLNDAAIKDPEAAGALRLDTSSETFGINWKQQWNDDWNQHITAGLVNSSNYFQIGTDPNGDPYYTDIVGHNMFVRPSLQWQTSADASATFGFEARRIDFPIDLYISEPPSNTAPDPGGFTSAAKYKVKRNLTATNYSPYVKYERQWNARWKTSLGLRYSNVRADQGANAPITKEQSFSPRVAAEYTWSDNTTLLMSWGDYFQLPRGFQQLADFGNPQLRFTRAEHRILGIEHKIDDTWSVKVEAYHKPMRDLVVGIEGASPPNNYLNEGEGEAYGADVFIKRTYDNRKLGWLSYSYARSKRTDLNTGITTNFAGDQPHTVTAVWGQPFTDDNGNPSAWDWGIKFQAHSGLPYTAVVGRTQEAGTGRWLPVYGGYNGDRLPVYAKLDVRFSKEVLYDTWKMKYVFDIQNITFRQNVSSFDYEDDWSDFNNPTIVSNDFFLPFFGIEAEF